MERARGREVVELRRGKGVGGRCLKQVPELWGMKIGDMDESLQAVIRCVLAPSAALWYPYDTTGVIAAHEDRANGGWNGCRDCLRARFELDRRGGHFMR